MDMYKVNLTVQKVTALIYFITDHIYLLITMHYGLVIMDNYNQYLK